MISGDIRTSADAPETFKRNRNHWAAAGQALYSSYCTNSEVQEDPDSTEDRPVGVELMHTSADTNGAAAPGSTWNLPERRSDAFPVSSAASLCSPSWFLSLWSQRLCHPGPGRSTLTCVDPSPQPVNFTRMAHLLRDLDRAQSVHHLTHHLQPNTQSLELLLRNHGLTHIRLEKPVITGCSPRAL